MAHYIVTPYPGARKQNDTKMFSDHHCGRFYTQNVKVSLSLWNRRLTVFSLEDFVTYKTSQPYAYPGPYAKGGGGYGGCNPPLNLSEVKFYGSTFGSYTTVTAQFSNIEGAVINLKWQIHIFPIFSLVLPRCMQCRRGLAMNSVRLSVCLSVCPSVTRVICDKMEERSVQIYIPYERTFISLLWEEKWLVGGDPFYLKFWINRPPLERNRRFSTNNRS